MRYDVAIVGGGIVGLSSAYNLLMQRPNTSLVLLEKEDDVAAHQTGNNSGVIHSGIYYKPGSLKAINCLSGYRMLLDFCDENKIPYDLCGKIIVATEERELEQLQILYDRGLENGLEGMTLLDSDGIAEHEPHVKGIKGIFVPQTGIIDYKLVSAKYREKIEEMGGEVLLEAKVEDIVQKNGELTIQHSKGETESRLLVNCAGLYSDKVASMQFPDVDTKIIPFRGEYYMLKPQSQHLVKHLIYPVPDPSFPFLGVHYTRMMNGHIEAGPNAVLAFRREGYKRSDIHLGELFESLTWPGFRKVMGKYWRTGLGEMYRSFSKGAFTKALQKLIPEIKKSDLEKAPAGVRAQACDRKGGLLDDFKIIENEQAVHVLNAPSPAATSSLAIGKTVAEIISKKL
jgi:(S)-2-hydroxyglutarate dehydrogenase